MSEERLYMDGHDNAVIGYGNQCSKDRLVIYSLKKIIENLVSQGMDEEEALEFADYNILGAYLGEGTPIICDDLSFEDELAEDRSTAEQK